MMRFLLNYVANAAIKSCRCTEFEGTTGDSSFDINFRMKVRVKYQDNYKTKKGVFVTCHLATWCVPENGESCSFMECLFAPTDEFTYTNTFGEYCDLENIFNSPSGGDYRDRIEWDFNELLAKLEGEDKICKPPLGLYDVCCQFPGGGDGEKKWSYLYENDFKENNNEFLSLLKKKLNSKERKKKKKLPIKCRDKQGDRIGQMFEIIELIFD